MANRHSGPLSSASLTTETLYGAVEGAKAELFNLGCSPPPAARQQPSSADRPQDIARIYTIMRERETRALGKPSEVTALSDNDTFGRYRGVRSATAARCGMAW